MPFPIQQLIEGRARPVTISPNQSVQEALDLMMKHDFSQLPIVGEDDRVQGIVTSDSILRGLHFTKTTIAKLHIIDIRTDAPTCLPDDEIFDVLEGMRNNYACLVVSEDKRLVGIITDFDTSEYFQRRAENIMLVEDIERTLKDFIQFAYPRAADGTESADLVTAVQQAVAPPQEFAQFKRAIIKYIRATVSNDENINPQHAKEAFAVLTARSTAPKGFDDLTLAEYISLFLNNNRWKQFQTAIKLDRELLRQMLEEVRLIRNKLFHFSGPVNETEQDHLRYCFRWLANHQNKVYDVFQSVAEPEPQIVSTPHELEHNATNLSRAAGDSRYTPLARYLKSEAENGETILGFSFLSIEKILGANLPPYARKHRSWWANDRVSRPQSRQWIGAGWRVKYVDMENEKAVFEILK